MFGFRFKIGSWVISCHPYEFVRRQLLGGKPVTSGNLLGFLADTTGYPSTAAFVDAVIAGYVTTDTIKAAVTGAAQAAALEAFITWRDRLPSVPRISSITGQ